jgi:hypothetical protein
MLRRVLLLIFAPVLFGHGCASALKNLDDLNNPADDIALKRCREEARAAKDAGADASAAYAAYYDCTKDAGLR